MSPARDDRTPARSGAPSAPNPWGAEVPPPTEAQFFNAARATAFLLVEGATDERFWLSRVEAHACQVRAVGGREKALEELRTTEREGILGVLAVLDADFDRLDGTLLQEANIVWTDSHDLDTVLIASPAFEKILVEVASRKKVLDFQASEGRTLRDALVARGAEMGRLRWLSRRERMSLSFRKARPDGSFGHVDHAKFCDRARWGMDVAKLVRAVLEYSNDHKMKAEVLLAGMRSLPEADVWQLCVGHDLVGLLVVGLRSRLGNRNLTMDEIEERLRLAFERSDLERTSMYRDIRRWEQQSKPFRLLSS